MSTLSLIQNTEDVQVVVECLKKETIISFDTEFIRENTFFPKVEILQIGTRSQTWIFDVKQLGREGLAPLFEVLTDPQILKIVHAAQGDQECLLTVFQQVAKPIFDTAIGASLLGLGEQISLANLLETQLGVKLKKGYTRTNWAVRPLPQGLVDYAHQDVQYLVACAESLMEPLKKQNRYEWALQLSSEWEDVTRFQYDPIQVARKISQNGNWSPESFSILTQLLILREQRAQKLNIPRKWICDDITLMDLAKTKPKTLDQLQSFRGLHKGEIKQCSELWLKTILDAQDPTKIAEYPKPEKKEYRVPTQQENLVVDLMKCYLGVVSEQSQISLKNLANAAQLLALLRMTQTPEFKGTESWVESGLLSPQASQIFGEGLLSLVQGKQALVTQGGFVRILSNF